MKSFNKRELILKGNMKKTILLLSAPIMFNNFVQTIYNVVDTYWVSKLGASEVAAMTLIFPVVFLIISLGIGMNVAGTAMVSQYVGGNQWEEASKISGQLLSLSFIISILFSILGFVSVPYVVSFMGATGDVFTHSYDYLRVIYWDMPLVFIFFVYTAIKQGQGDTFTPMIINVGGVLLNIVLDPIFIFTLNLGIRGAAYATILSRGVFILYAIYTLFNKKSNIYLNKNRLVIKKDALLKIIKIGLPASVGQSVSAFGFIILNIFVISYGETTLAAFGIGNKVTSLVTMPALGIGSAIATIIGQNIGANQMDRVKEALKTSISMTCALLMVGGFIMFLSSYNIMRFFIHDPEVILQGAAYCRLISISLPFLGIFQVLVGTFQGSGRTIYAMFMDIGRLWLLRIPMIVLFKHYTDWGSNSVWYAMILSNIFICGLGYIMYSKGSWQGKAIHQEETCI
ncbi:putative efflux protein, MATE family [Natronincola peptidivorans]|uniref:Putative efflux protein, MATE family n=1 Tax=Natronincola peptidivorans TaxID=426128 RepID=A0A1I0C7J1_9FIRM|nr:MATE family efflux transporter [Natronincola peptidivorans]SET15524.1 putative efflux protein, MATE family [Natronincola peptidivorans]